LRSLITGIAGFAGSHLAEHLLAQGEDDLWGVVHHKIGYAKPLADQVHLEKVDLRNPNAVHQLLVQVQPTHIYHLAGQAYVPVSWQDPWATLETNIRSQLNLLQAAVALELDAHILAVSSNEVYGHVEAESLPFSEDMPIRPVNPYGVSKAAQDILGLQYYLSHKLYVVRVRPFNHIGPRQNERFVASYFARQIAEIEAGLRPPTMRVGNMAAQRDFTDVRDIVKAYRLALWHGKPGEVYNVGTGKPRSVQELLDRMLAMSTAAIHVEVDKTLFRTADIPISYCDASKLQQHTGWQPTIPFEQTVCDILDDWRRRVMMKAR